MLITAKSYRCSLSMLASPVLLWISYQYVAQEFCVAPKAEQIQKILCIQNIEII